MVTEFIMTYPRPMILSDTSMLKYAEKMRSSIWKTTTDICFVSLLLRDASTIMKTMSATSISSPNNLQEGRGGVIYSIFSSL